MNDLFRGPGFSVRPVVDNDIPAVLKVYRQCEDFLSLGPVPRASLDMVLADIAHSRKEGGSFCGIWNDAGELTGVLDFIPRRGKGIAFLSLLMIALPHRRRGSGTAVLAALETYLQRTYGTRIIKSGVQVNNEAGIRFWRACGFHIGRRARRHPDKTIAYNMKKRL